MTRLLSDDICDISETLAGYDGTLTAKTGFSLKQIAAHAVGTDEDQLNNRPEKAAVIPMTCGQGIIEGFSETVADIVRFLGITAFVTKAPDAGGVAEAVENGAEILLMADDNKFVAVNLTTGKTADNSKATGEGFAAALDLMAAGLINKKVLILGAGPVGFSAALSMVKFGADLSVYDINPSNSIRLAAEISCKFGCTVRVEKDPESALLSHQLLYDASPAAALIQKKHVSEKTLIAAPGVPLGISEDCISLVWKRLIHDPLQIGVATMIFEVLKK